LFRDSNRYDKKYFNNTDAITNCYCIDQSGTTYAYNNPLEDRKNWLGISFRNDDVIEIELDKIDWVLKFKNSKFSSTSSIKITEIPAIPSQSYHICLGFITSGQKTVQILSPIST
jgi:hypothetical protein